VFEMRRIALLAVSLLALILFAVAGCARPVVQEEPTMSQDRDVALLLTSSAFAGGGEIPAKYSCDGESISPPLNWGHGPPGTVSFALILEDPDAPIKNFTHWVIFNLPPDTPGLPEALPKDDTLASGALQGKNGGGGIGYIGPCPPKGPAHHYVFNLYALDKSLDLAVGATKDQVRQAMQEHILAESMLVGIYQRK
jgi:Raf kinase inhibitor-like YbhB/YbcL family protein